MTFQTSQQAYGIAVGATPTNSPFISSDDPNSNDVNFLIGKFWINTSDESLWYLNSFSTSSGVLSANWISIQSSLQTLSDTADTPVSPSSGTSTPPNNIQLTSSDGSITILSDAADNLIDFTVAGGTTTVETLTGDTGTATPTLGNINIIAGNSTRNSGSTVKIVGASSTLTLSVTDSSSNTIIGNSSGNLTLTGTVNTSVGVSNFSNITTGTGNCAFGVNSISLITTGIDNVGYGNGTLSTLLTGSSNLALGFSSGSSYTSSESSNILINSSGTIGDSNTLRIGAGTGTSSQQINKAFISGINGVTVSNTKIVTINSSTDQLGTASSSLIFAWTDEATNFQSIAGNGYFCTAALLIGLPTSPSQGDTISFNTVTASNVIIGANSGQTIVIGSSSSTVAGQATSSAIGNSVTLVYRSTGATWRATSSVGTWVLT